MDYFEVCYEGGERKLKGAEVCDMVVFDRKAGLYTHWAVYIGNNYVVHVNTSKSDEKKGSEKRLFYSKKQIRIDKWFEVEANEKKIWKGNDSYDQNTKLEIEVKNPGDILETIIHLLYNESIEYHLLTMNCEHFATFCRYGIPMSNQGKKFTAGKDWNKTKKKYEIMMKKKVVHTSSLKTGKKEKPILKFLSSCPEALDEYNTSKLQTADIGDVLFWRSTDSYFRAIYTDNLPDGNAEFVSFNSQNSKVEKTLFSEKKGNALLRIEKRTDKLVQKYIVVQIKDYINMP